MVAPTVRVVAVLIAGFVAATLVACAAPAADETDAAAPGGGGRTSDWDAGAELETQPPAGALVVRVRSVFGDVIVPSRARVSLDGQSPVVLDWRGQHQFADVEAGARTLRAWAPGYFVERATVMVGAGNGPVYVLRLQPRYRVLRGFVRDSDGGVPDVVVRATELAIGSGTYFRYAARPGGDSAFELRLPDPPDNSEPAGVTIERAGEVIDTIEIDTARFEKTLRDDRVIDEGDLGVIVLAPKKTLADVQPENPDVVMELGRGLALLQEGQVIAAVAVMRAVANKLGTSDADVIRRVIRFTWQGHAADALRAGESERCEQLVDAGLKDLGDDRVLKQIQARRLLVSASSSCREHWASSMTLWRSGVEADSSWWLERARESLEATHQDEGANAHYKQRSKAALRALYQLLGRVYADEAWRANFDKRPVDALCAALLSRWYDPARTTLQSLITELESDASVKDDSRVAEVRTRVTGRLALEAWSHEVVERAEQAEQQSEAQKQSDRRSHVRKWERQRSEHYVPHVVWNTGIERGVLRVATVFDMAFKGAADDTESELIAIDGTVELGIAPSIDTPFEFGGRLLFTRSTAWQDRGISQYLLMAGGFLRVAPEPDVSLTAHFMAPIDFSKTPITGTIDSRTDTTFDFDVGLTIQAAPESDVLIELCVGYPRSGVRLGLYLPLEETTDETAFGAVIYTAAWATLFGDQPIEQSGPSGTRQNDVGYLRWTLLAFALDIQLETNVMISLHWALYEYDEYKFDGDPVVYFLAFPFGGRIATSLRFQF